MRVSNISGTNKVVRISLNLRKKYILITFEIVIKISYKGTLTLAGL